LRGAERWQARSRTLEAMALLVIARALIAGVPLRRWRSTLGRPVPPQAGRAEPECHSDNQEARRLARAVRRAADRLPGETRCLPQAMALQWLLRRRGFDATLYIGVLPGRERGGLGDLHAWVDCRGEVLIGETAEVHLPLYAAAVPERRT
jgi:hypothetical protein